MRQVSLILVCVLPRRYRCRKPPDRKADGACLLAKEHSGRVWLWRWPQLLDWRGGHGNTPDDIAWLGVYGHAGNGYPGDMWGLDRRGTLLIVELKVWPGRDDPFYRFASVASAHFATDFLEHDWRRRLRMEREYAPIALRLLSQHARQAPRTAPGVLPYASRREALHAWPQLYKALVGRSSSAEYERDVERRFLARQNRFDPPPHFIGFAVLHRDRPVLRGAWNDAYEVLCRTAGRARVHRRAAIARIGPSGRTTIAPVRWVT